MSAELGEMSTQNILHVSTKGHSGWLAVESGNGSKLNMQQIKKTWIWLCRLYAAIVENECKWNQKNISKWTLSKTICQKASSINRNIHFLSSNSYTCC